MDKVSWDECLTILLEDSIDPARYLKLRQAVAKSIEIRHKLAELASALKRDAAAAGKKLTRADADVKAAVALWVLGRSAEALVLVADSELAEGCYVAGQCALELGDFERAAKSFQAALGLEKENLAILCGMLEAKLKAEPTEEIVRTITAALKKYPDSAELLYVLGLAHHYMGAYKEEIESYEKALQIAPDYAPALLRLGFLYNLQDSTEEAGAYYTKLSQGSPVFLSALVNLGLYYEDRREYTRAAECYRAVLRTYPTHERARLYLKDALGAVEMMEEEHAKQVPEPTRQELAAPVTSLDLSTRTRNALLSIGVQTLNDLIQRTERDLSRARNMGEQSLEEIKNFLSQRGLRLKDVELTLPEAVPAGPPMPRPEDLEASIQTIGISLRGVKALDAAGIKTVGDLVNRTEKELLAVRNFGRVSLAEVKQKLAARGLRLREPGEVEIK